MLTRVAVIHHELKTKPSCHCLYFHQILTDSENTITVMLSKSIFATNMDKYCLGVFDSYCVQLHLLLQYLWKMALCIVHKISLPSMCISVVAVYVGVKINYMKCRQLLTVDVLKHSLLYLVMLCLHCVNTVGWVTGRASCRNNFCFRTPWV